MKSFSNVNTHVSSRHKYNAKNDTISLLRQELIEGLTADQKYIDSKFFYDSNGAKLFEWITKLPEYYPTRTEKDILQKNGQNLFGHLSHIDLVELGSGDCSKISIVLNHIPLKQRHSITYRPVDFSADSICKSTQLLHQAFPQLNIEGIEGDFTKLESLPNSQPRIICFFGSTIGNFDAKRTHSLMKNLVSIMNTGDQLLIGMDMVKDNDILKAAYNDSQRITEAFNRNILRNCNNILETNFWPTDFEHKAFFNHKESRVEMHLIAKSNLYIKSPLFKQTIVIEEGENIHTENSYKYTKRDIETMANQHHLLLRNLYTDSQEWFSIAHYIKQND